MAHKGFGLGLMVEILGGLLTGAGVSEPGANRLGNGIFAVIVNIESFMPRDEFARRLSDLLDYIRNCPTREGFDEVLVPGDPEERTQQKRLAEGIPVDDETWGQLTELAGSLSVEVPSL